MMLLSSWGKNLDTAHPLPLYPRPQLVRDNWLNLNGLWQYQINHGEQPSRTVGWKTIVVPFALGSKLSGTTDQLLPEDTLWYRRTFRLGEVPKGRTMLNFEAVDQVCEVWLNGQKVGRHEGGYAPFGFDVTRALQTDNEILAAVKDASDQGLYAYGKQKLTHHGMWYTPSSGIYGTVWMETLPDHAITGLKITPDLKEECVYLRLKGNFHQAVISVFEEKQLVHRAIIADKEYTIPLPGARRWSCQDPFLYTLYIQTEEETVRSYFGMRSFSLVRDARGFPRFALNGSPLFLSGLLDQGYSVDGLLTYPSEEAMRFELTAVKDMGFNMIRKHIKVENRRWYALCDELGLLVMQDMPSGGGPYDFKRIGLWPTLGRTHFGDGPADYAANGRAGRESRDIYYKELGAMLENLYNCPCIFAWVPFNEGWGQFDSAKATAGIRQADATRLVDSASGWFDQGAGDFDSRHCYFHRFHMPRPADRIVLLSEFGGYTYVEHGHSEPHELYGYKKFQDKLRYNDAIEALYARDVLAHIPKGLSGCIYTQTADVEDECNGLFTADRAVLKVDTARMRRINERLYKSMNL
jgi:beta-galactosidase/beta-glucuronidase